MIMTLCGCNRWMLLRHSPLLLKVSAVINGICLPNKTLTISWTFLTHVSQVGIELAQPISLVTVTRRNTNDRLAQLCHHHHHGV